ncbi:hypothetical protein DDF65_04630 [Caulobacter radicis]|uniref:Uncharacterized protein n=1 Tax=Caulobacter radicis TaxID=2172650 RepID=A0A2T9JT75_9CAUL|nr:hypothetical protein DDF65_04630 [Caulobacter radicis]
MRGRWRGAIGDVTEGATAGTASSLAPSTTSWSPSPAGGGGAKTRKKPPRRIGAASSRPRFEWKDQAATAAAAARPLRPQLGRRTSGSATCTSA